MAKIPNLREWEPTAPAQDVEASGMLNTTAREVADNVSGKNSNTEDTNSTPSFGELGAKGRC